MSTVGKISKEEFNEMVDQLLNDNEVKFDALCSIAERTLRSTVVHWCVNDPYLCGKQLEDDIMQEIYIRLIKTCKSSFLLRNGVDGEINNDPEGFKSWLFKVAINIKRDFASSTRNLNFKEREFADGEEEKISDDTLELSENSEERNELLKAAFGIVLNSDSQIYKILTWIAQCLFILKFDITKIQSNGMIVEQFEDKTLREMYQLILDASKTIPWVVISTKQCDKIEAQLSDLWIDGRMYGQVKYSEFFMKKGGKATISDWVNRMNNMIKRVVRNESSNN